MLLIITVLSEMLSSHREIGFKKRKRLLTQPWLLTISINFTAVLTDTKMIVVRDSFL